jgi:SAM-dependent methyltransferase
MLRDLKRKYRRIHPLDTMFEIGKGEEYFKIGKRAYEICAPLVSCKGKNIRILDFPSGYGRVLRHFRNAHPAAEIFACELDSRMLDFVASEFDASPIQSKDDLDIELPTNLDLIFMGSLLTHFSENQWEKIFNLIEPCIEIGGHIVFTTHGRLHFKMASEGHPIFGDLIDVIELFKEAKSSGFSYAPYDPSWPSFGLSLSSPDWIMKKLVKWPNLKVHSFSEASWGQDVWILEKIDFRLNEL